MRIPIDLLPPIESLPGSFRTVYAHHYKSLLGWSPGELVALKNNQIKALAKEIYMNHILQIVFMNIVMILKK